MASALQGLAFSDIHWKQPALEPKAGSRFRMGTLNVLGFPGDMASKPDIGGLLPWKQRITKLKAAMVGFDFLGLQEVLGDLGRALIQDSEFGDIRREYNEIHVVGSCWLGFPGGVAILSKHRIERIEVVPFKTKIADGHWMKRVFVIAQIGRKVFVVTHMASGHKDKTGSTARFFGGRQMTIKEVRNAQASEILEKLAQDYAGVDAYIMGDLNCNGLDPDEYNSFPFNPANGLVQHCVVQEGKDYDIEQFNALHRIEKKRDLRLNEALKQVDDNEVWKKMTDLLGKKDDDDWVQLYHLLRPLLPLKDPYRTSSNFWGCYAQALENNPDLTEKEAHEKAIELHNSRLTECPDRGAPFEESLDRIVFVGTDSKVIACAMTQMYDPTQTRAHQTTDHHRLEATILWA